MPLRDIFAALFFVSVGMLIDPLFVVHHWAWVLVVLVIIVLVKGVISAGLVSLFGFPPRVALLTGAALAQSAEFSFLLARLGLDLDAVSRSVYDTLLAGSVASILVAPFLHSVTHRLAVSVDRIIPARAPRSVPTSDTSGNGLRGHADHLRLWPCGTGCWRSTETPTVPYGDHRAESTGRATIAPGRHSRSDRIG